MELKAIVTRACELHTNTEKTVESVLKSVANDKAAVKALLWAGANTLVQEYRHNARRAFKGKATSCGRGGVGLALASASAENARQVSNENGMLDMIVNGMRFGDMTGDEAIELSKNAHAQMIGNQFDRDFYREVGKRAGKGKIQDKLTGKALEKIREKIHTSLSVLRED